MKLDPSALRHLTDDDFRVLTAVEMGMRNHELVPIPLISSISSLRHGGYMRALKQVHKHKLVHKETKRYIGYRLTSLGYDYLAMRALVRRGVIDAVGRALGVGKEADVFIVTASEQLTDEHEELADEPLLAMKLHRLGRTSFRAVKSKRDYLVHRKAASWIYFSRLAAMKEYAFMCALHQRGFPVPRPLGQSRHVVIMQLCPGKLLTQVYELPDAVETANTLIGIVVRFAQHGLVHCDLNEFNIIVDEDGEVTVIDFPQMVSTSHADANSLFERDANGIRRFFSHRFNVADDDMICPDLHTIISERGEEDQIDTIVSASGFRNSDESSQYGVQDLGDDEEDIREAIQSIDPSTLQISDHPTEKANDGVAPEIDQDGNTNGSSTDSSENSDEHDGSANNELSAALEDGEVEELDGPSIQKTALNQAAIQARVRRQRANQKQRRQLATRNIIKDSEKRKVRAEMDCEVWR